MAMAIRGLGREVCIACSQGAGSRAVELPMFVLQLKYRRSEYRRNAVT
jgi:hypothetical protein